jgi:hypothetical protein
MSKGFLEQWLDSEDRGAFTFDMGKFGIDPDEEKQKRKRR